VDQILGDISKGVTTRSRVANFCEQRWAMMDPPSSFVFEKHHTHFATSSFVKTKHFVLLEQG
jgi:hypothetical protein